MDVKINVINNIKLCTHCMGAGKLKAMQSVAIYGGGSVRGEDIQIKCRFCNGSGVTN